MQVQVPDWRWRDDGNLIESWFAFELVGHHRLPSRWSLKTSMSRYYDVGASCSRWGYRERL